MGSTTSAKTNKPDYTAAEERLANRWLGAVGGKECQECGGTCWPSKSFLRQRKFKSWINKRKFCCKACSLIYSRQQANKKGVTKFTAKKKAKKCKFCGRDTGSKARIYCEEECRSLQAKRDAKKAGQPVRRQSNGRYWPARIAPDAGDFISSPD